MDWKVRSIAIFKIFEFSKDRRSTRGSRIKVRSTPIFKIFEKCYLEFIETHERVKNLSVKNIDARIFFQKKIERLIDSNFQNLRKVLPRNSFVEDHERVREDLAVAKHGLESSIDSNFQNLQKVLPRYRRQKIASGSRIY